jgi:hypothetical protein
LWRQGLISRFCQHAIEREREGDNPVWLMFLGKAEIPGPQAE